MSGIYKEYKEENLLTSKIIQSFNELAEKQQEELKKLQEQNKEETYQKINQLREEIRTKKIELDTDINNLPFGALSSAGGFKCVAYNDGYITIKSSDERAKILNNILSTGESQISINSIPYYLKQYLKQNDENNIQKP